MASGAIWDKAARVYSQQLPGSKVVYEHCCKGKSCYSRQDMFQKNNAEGQTDVQTDVGSVCKNARRQHITRPGGGIVDPAGVPAAICGYLSWNAPDLSLRMPTLHLPFHWQLHLIGLWAVNATFMTDATPRRDVTSEQWHCRIYPTQIFTSFPPVSMTSLSISCIHLHTSLQQ